MGMKQQQFPFYAACPILYWPWLWLQFWRLDRWMEGRLAAGEHGNVMLHMGPRGTLRITLVSDNLNEDITPRFTTLTFESLTWAYFPDWMYTVARAVLHPATISGQSAPNAPRLEISEALLPIP